jgi:hypothetical protein
MHMQDRNIKNGERQFNRVSQLAVYAKLFNKLQYVFAVTIVAYIVSLRAGDIRNFIFTAVKAFGTVRHISLIDELCAAYDAALFIIIYQAAGDITHSRIPHMCYL